MRRVVWLLLVLAMLAAACGDDDGGDTSPPATDAPPTTEAPPATDPPPTTTEAPPATEAPPTTEAPPATEAPPPADGGLAITEVVFGEDGHVTITNLGGAEASLDGMWLCNRPQYLALAGTLAAGASTQIPASDIPPLRADGGDLGLYSDADFGNPDAIVDYVAWGGGGGRLTTAVAAGIWPDGDAVAGGGASISAPAGGASAADWSS